MVELKFDELGVANNRQADFSSHLAEGAFGDRVVFN